MAPGSSFWRIAPGFHLLSRYRTSLQLPAHGAGKAENLCTTRQTVAHYREARRSGLTNTPWEAVLASRQRMREEGRDFTAVGFCICPPRNLPSRDATIPLRFVPTSADVPLPASLEFLLAVLQFQTAPVQSVPASLHRELRYRIDRKLYANAQVRSPPCSLPPDCTCGHVSKKYICTSIYVMMYIKRVESVFDIIAEPNRRAILSLLVSSEQSVGEIERQLRMPQPTVSKHLRVLRESGFVEASVDGQRRLYRLKPEPLKEVDAWLAPFRSFWAAHVDALERHLDRIDQSPSMKRKGRKS